MKHNRFTSFLSKNSPELLMGTGLALMIGSVGLSAYCTYKYDERIRKENRARIHENKPELTKKEKIKMGVKYYAPTVAATICAAACFVASDRVHAKRNAALATICGASETALQIYKDKVVEFLGAEKEAELSDEIVKEQAISAAKDIPTDRPEPTGSEVVIEKNPKDWFYEPKSGRWFESDSASIKDAVAELKNMVVNDGSASLGEWYDLIDLDRTDGCEYVGWNSNHGLPSITIVPKFDINGISRYAIKYSTPPKFGFESNWS